MAPIRIDSTLISKQQTALDKIEKQSKSWVLFFTITLICLFILTILGIIVNFDIATSKIDYLFFLIIGVCIFWWFWTINFIYHAVKNQKIIYLILADIEKEIKSIKNSFVNNKKN